MRAGGSVAIAWAIGGVACVPDLDGTSSTASDGEATTEAGSSTIASTGIDASSTGATAGVDVSSSDAMSSTDASSTGSTASADTSSTSSTDASSTSTGGVAGLGTIAGDCGLIDAMELESPAAFTFANAIDFGEIGFDYDLLTEGGQEVHDDGNLGGSSLFSEIIAFEVLARCDGAVLLATESEIAYTDVMGKKTDLLVEVDDLVVGVSVTRAVSFPFEDPYPVAEAQALLEDKLADILESTANVAPKHAWVKQILHVIAYADLHADSMFEAYAMLPEALTVDTILVVTVTHGEDAFVY
jgi:hypothetical protein